MRIVSIHGDLEVLCFDYAERQEHQGRYGVRRKGADAVLMKFKHKRDAVRFARIPRDKDK